MLKDIANGLAIAAFVISLFNLGLTFIDMYFDRKLGE